MPNRIERENYAVLILTIAVVTNSKANADLINAAQITIQPIYINSYPDIIGAPSESTIQARLAKDLEVANVIFAQASIKIVPMPLRVVNLTIANPSSSLTRVFNPHWESSDFNQLRNADPLRNTYLASRTVPIYIVPDFDEPLGNAGSAGQTIAPIDVPAGPNPSDYAAIIYENYAPNSTLAHELGHFLLNGALFANRVAYQGTDGTHLDDASSLMAPTALRTNSVKTADYAPVGSLAQLRFDPVVDPATTGERPASQVWAMHHRGAESGYLTHVSTSPYPAGLRAVSTLDHVGQYVRGISSGSSGLTLDVADISEGELIVTSTVPNDPTDTQVLKFAVQHSIRRIGSFIEINYQMDFEAPYNFTFQGGADGEFLLTGTIFPFSLTSPVLFERLTGPATLQDASVCRDALCETVGSANVVSFTQGLFPSPAPAIGVVHQLSLKNDSIVGADALQWTIRVPAQFAPILPGDFNGDNRVDASDYVTWRRGLGTQFTVADYNTWRASFGQDLGNAGSGSGYRAEVPEPAHEWLLVLAAAFWFIQRPDV